MIWRWMYDAIVFLLKLVIPPPSKEEVPRIDANAACPACGNKTGKIRLVKLPNNEMMIRHDCLACAAAWHQKTVLTARNVIHPPAEAKK